MSAYLSYMKAFSSDLRQIAVWEPGTQVKVGDYGEIKNKRWEVLGNVWDLIPDADERLREWQSSELDLLSLGSAEVVSGSSDTGYGSLVGNLSIAIRFRKEHAVFVRAEKCETRSLRRVQDIAEKLVRRGVWHKSWSLVSEVRSARRFLVLVSVAGDGEVQVSAKTQELLNAFKAGQVRSEDGIQITGSAVLQFLGRSGPINMSLMRVRGPGLLNPHTKARRVDFAEGKVGAPGAIYIEDVDAQSFLDQLDTGSK